MKLFASETEKQTEKLRSAFEQAFARTEAIFNLITPEAYYKRPIPLRHPINFYEGHLPAFIWNTVFKKVFNESSFNTHFDKLFERGIDPADLNAADAATIHIWPRRNAVTTYKRLVHARLFQLLGDRTQHRNTHLLMKRNQVLWLVLEHELMHQETLLYMIHQLPPQYKTVRMEPRSVEETAPPPRMVEVSAGITLLGTAPNTVDFAWDNEMPQQHVDVSAFSMDMHQITNGQFLEFIEAGGYQRREFWTPETWCWKEEQGKTHPFFWQKMDNQWLLKEFFSVIPLPLSWPVYVTHAEASAYACFSGKSLPTEAEWHRAAYGNRMADYPWGNEPPTDGHGNFDFQQFSPSPVGSYHQGTSPYGIHDMLGNGWEWTSTPFSPFPGFQPSESYPRYSVDFFDGQHYIVKGGSCFTDQRLLRRSFRNWFYWHYPYMYATFRCVQRG